MAQASRSLPFEVSSENPTNPVIEAPRAIHAPPTSYILKFENGLFLRDYLDSQCVLTAVLGEAKNFYSLAVAERNAKLLKATVAPGPRVEPTLDSRAGSMSFLPAVTSVRNVSAIEALASCIVESADNAVFVGIQKGFTCGGKKTPPLALFNSRKTGSTLALPILELSTHRVRRVVSDSDESFVKPVADDQILSRLRKYRESEFQQTNESYRRIVDSLGE